MPTPRGPPEGGQRRGLNGAYYSSPPASIAALTLWQTEGETWSPCVNVTESKRCERRQTTNLPTHAVIRDLLHCLIVDIVPQKLMSAATSSRAEITNNSFKLMSFTWFSTEFANRFLHLCINIYSL